MSQETSPSMGTLILTFLAGATVGAVVVALTTPKTGSELRGDLKDLALSTKRKAADLADGANVAWDDVKERSAHAASDLKRGVSDAVSDLRG